MSEFDLHYIETMGEVPPALREFAELAPAAFAGYSAMRAWILREDQEAALPLKYRHLIVAAVDVALGRVDGAENHAHAALRAGATADEVSDAMFALVLACGMPAWGHGGREVVALARQVEASAKGSPSSE
jgi:alkylhydroperoxidase/carboxymuconolactone decarboxylase family protein YurZ